MRAAPGCVEIVRGLAPALAGEPLPEAPGRARGARSRRSTRSSRGTATARASSSRATGSTPTGSRASSSSSATRCSSSATRPRSRCTCTPTIPGRRSRSATALGVIERVEIANMHAQTCEREERLLGAPGAAPTLETGSSRSPRARATGGCSRASARRPSIEGGQTMNPSTAEIVDGDRGDAAPRGDRPPEQLERASSTAEQAVELAREARPRRADRSIQAGLAAMVALRAANAPRARTRRRCSRRSRRSLTGEVTVASRDVDAGRRRRSGRARTSASSTAQPWSPAADFDDGRARGRRAAARRRRASVLTVLIGEDAPPLDGLARADRRRGTRARASRSHDGGQPHYPLLLSPSDAEGGEPIRVVLVEDNEVFRETLELLLGLRARPRGRRRGRRRRGGGRRVPRARAGRGRDRLPAARTRRRRGDGGGARALPRDAAVVVPERLGRRARSSSAARGAARSRCVRKDEELDAIVEAIHAAAGRERA